MLKSSKQGRNTWGARALLFQYNTIANYKLRSLWDHTKTPQSKQQSIELPQLSCGRLGVHFEFKGTRVN